VDDGEVVREGGRRGEEEVGREEPRRSRVTPTSVATLLLLL
jgi:hypothetical protein